jgi:signal transduction histidine kinase
LIPEAENKKADPEEAGIRFIQNAIELALTVGDFQKEIDHQCTPETIASETVQRIGRMVPFEASAIYFVDEQTSDLNLSASMPANGEDSLQDEMTFMIENGFVAWAMRERRGIKVYSKDGSRQVLLHVMATYARIRGIFIGIFPPPPAKIQNASLQILSIILRNAVNCLESLIYSSMMRQQQKELKEEVEQKTSQLLNYEKQLMQAQHMEAVAALAGGVAHQFNNSLQALIGYIDLTVMLAQNDPKILSNIERTYPVINQMSTLTNKLLAYARGGTVVNPQVISLKELFNEVIPTVKGSVKETVDLKVAPCAAATTVKVDLIQLRTVVMAIVANADEAIVEHGSIRISSQLFPWAQIPEAMKSKLTPGDYACLQFDDDGTGMDNDTLRRLFEPFFSTKFEGRGLSMAAVSGIIKQHRGWVDVSSQIGRGTCVQVYLPRVS